MNQKQRLHDPCPPSSEDDGDQNEGQALKAATAKLAAAEQAITKALSQDSESYIETQKQHGGQ